MIDFIGAFGGFALIGGEQIGQEIVRSIGSSKAILMQNHGVFTIGKNAAASSAFNDYELVAVAVIPRALTAAEIAQIRTYYGTA